MSTAIMHTGAFYDFGDFTLKNQTNSRSTAQMTIPTNNTNSNASSNSSSASSSPLIGSSSSSGSSSNSNSHHVTSSQILLQQNFNVSATVTQQQQQHHNQNQHHHHPHHTQQAISSRQQHHNHSHIAPHQLQESAARQFLIHNALTRTASHPVSTQTTAAATMETLMELLRMSTAAGAVLPQPAATANRAGSSNTAASLQAAAVAAAAVSGGGGHRKLERTQSEPLPQQVNTSRYKTELCRPFEEAGECKYGDKCQFAHGMQELRNLQRHPKYKTELCRTFHSVGFCPYGPRCHFVHNAEEARNHNLAAFRAQLVAAASANSAAAGGGGAAGQAGNQNANAAAAAAAAVLQQAQLQQTAVLLQQQQQQQQQHQHQQQQQHQLPLSPALSMSTGSDRASPIGSLSLSPTTSMASFFPEQGSPTFPAATHGQSQTAFNFPASPPASPIDGGLSPMTTPPPPSPSLASLKAASNAVDSDTRLPVFNRLSSTVDAFTNLMI